MDRHIARAILAGQIDGLITVSADIDGVNQHSIRAAAKQQIPVVGTGACLRHTLRAPPAVRSPINVN